MGDADVEAVHLLHDGIELLTRGRRVDAVPGELGGGPQTRQRVSQPMGHRGRHLPDRRQLFGLHQLRARLAQLLGHPGEGPRQLADLVRRAGHDGVVQVARPDDRHRLPQLVQRAREIARNEP